MKRIHLLFALGFTIMMVQSVWALPNNGRIPILTYHSWSVNDHAGMEEDLQTLNAYGYKIVPLFWATQWMLGERDGSTLPEKPIAISFDDGDDRDWYDEPGLKSFRTILQDFKASHPNQPNTHGSSFVIASPVARDWISPTGDLRDDWWAAANASGIMEIYNHSADHDHPRIGDLTNDGIPGPYVPSYDPSLYDPDLGIYVAVGAGAGGGHGDGSVSTFNAYPKCNKFVRKAAEYIATKIAPAWPDLFAYPFDPPTMSPYLWQTYFPNNMSEHGTVAAFVGGRNDMTTNYMTRADNRWTVNRFVYSGAFPNGWSNQNELITILQYGLSCSANGLSIACPTMTVYSPTLTQGRAVVNATSTSVIASAQNNNPLSYISTSSFARYVRRQAATGTAVSGSMGWYYAWATPQICLGPGDNEIELMVRDQWDNVAKTSFVIEAPLTNPICAN